MGGPGSRLVLIVPPMVQLLILCFSGTREVHNLVLGVYNEDQGLASRELLDRLHAIPETFSRSEDFAALRSAQEALAVQRVVSVLDIEQTFSMDLLSGGAGLVQVLADCPIALVSLTAAALLFRQASLLAAAGK